MRALRLTIAASLLCAGLSAGVAATSDVDAAPARATDGVCTTRDGVTVVIDFQQLGGGVHVRCAPQPAGTGFEALRQAGIDFQTTVKFPGFLCKIAGKPANDPCQTASPATAYWSYWLAPRGGQWCYSNWGAGNRRPPPGSVEGWSFSSNTSASTSPAPRLAVPGPLPGTAPGALPGNDCDASRSAPRPSPTPPTPSAPSPSPSPAPAPPPSTTAPVPPPGADPSGAVSMHEQQRDGAPSGAAGTASSDGAAGAGPGGPSTTGAIGHAPSPEGGPAAEVEAAAEGAEAEDGTVFEDEETAAIDLNGDARSSGSPTGVIVAVALVVVLAAAAFFRHRRNASAPS